MNTQVARLVGGGLAAWVLGVGLLSVAAPPAQAVTLTVDSLTDDGAGLTLREAIEAANADQVPDTITFAQPGTITLAGPLPAITSPVTIDASEVGGVTVDANQTGRVFHVTSTGDLTVDHLTLTGGLVDPEDGGGIYNRGGVLTVRDSTITGNAASLGGGIASFGGRLTLTGSTIGGNSAGQGGGLFAGGAQATVVANSTIAQNSASLGGAIYAASNPGDGNQLDVRSSTIAFNQASQNEIVEVAYSSVTFADSVLVGTGADLCGPVGDGGGNLSWPAGSDCPGVHADPLLGALADNGGPTATMAPGVGSPAIDAAAGTQPATDQRGLPRPQGAAGDAGAVEVQAPTIAGMPPAGLVGTGYSYGFTLTGDPAPSLPAPTAAMTTGSPPPGLTLSSSGVLSGTPTTAGTYPFTVTASSAGGTASVPVTVTIAAATTATKADLTVSLTAPTTKPIGQPFGYQVATKNTGPATATTVYTVLALPAGVELVSATPGYTRVGQLLYWPAPTLAKGATLTYAATVQATTTGSKLARAAGLSVTTPDPKPANNLTARLTKITG